MLAAAFICGFGTLDFEIHHHGVLSASDDHSFAGHIWARINLLVRDVGRNINEISGVGFIAEL